MPKKIKVAMVAPSFGETGGPEVVVKNLINAMQKREEVDVTLFAPADWKNIVCKHVKTIPQSLWNMKSFGDQSEYFRKNLILENLLKVTLYQHEFDIIHLHSYRYAYAVATLLKKPCVLTLHSKINKQEFGQMKKIGLKTVSLSRAHRKNFKTTAIIGNGIDVDKIKPSFKSGEYLITVGRILENKGIDLAIEIAKKANKKLLIFGRIGVGSERQDYFNKKIKPFLNEKIVYMGEVSQKKLFSYMRNAEALIFPIRANLSVCPLIVMESLACGTPVVGCRVHPLEDIPGFNKVSFLSDDLEKLSKAIIDTDNFNRYDCRKFAEKNFNSEIMAEKYIELYESIL